MVRLVRLLGPDDLFRAGILPQGGPDRAAAERGGDLRRRLPDAADRRLADGHLFRPPRAQVRAGAVGRADGRRVAADRRRSDLCAAPGCCAPAVLVLARMLQGLSVGGEYGASATYLSEMAMRDRRAFWASFQYVTLIGGQLLALARRGPAAVHDVRSAFAGMGLARRVRRRRAARARRSMSCAAGWPRRKSFTDAGRRSARSRRCSSCGGDHPREFLIVAAISAGGSIAFYAYTTYMQKFLVNTSGFSRSTATEIMTVALVVFMLIQPLWGLAADRWGRKPIAVSVRFRRHAGVVPGVHRHQPCGDPDRPHWG